MSTIAYITARTPLGKGEEFIITELLALRKKGARLCIMPRDKATNLFNGKAGCLMADTLVISLFDLRVIVVFLRDFALHPIIMTKLIRDITLKARSLNIAIKNLAVLPKAIFLSNFLKKSSVDHIHVHWGTTTSTMGYIISMRTDIPWSLTLHRGDIKEDNLLKLKVSNASFARCISEHGKRMVLDIIGQMHDKKIVVIPMGVEIGGLVRNTSVRNDPFIIAVPASLFPVKGHKYLIDACSLLVKRGIEEFKCLFFGEGYLKAELLNYVKKAGLADFITMQGQIPNEALIDLYRAGKVDAVILPSINTNDGDHEGIPVSLMEAMACCIPVISTNTGGIPELIGDGSGMMVEEKNPEALADAIGRIMDDTNLCKELSERGRHKVKLFFDADAIAGELLKLYSSERIH